MEIIHRSKWHDEGLKEPFCFSSLSEVSCVTAIRTAFLSPVKPSVYGHWGAAVWRRSGNVFRRIGFLPEFSPTHTHTHHFDLTHDTSQAHVKQGYTHGTSFIMWDMNRFICRSSSMVQMKILWAARESLLYLLMVNLSWTVKMNCTFTCTGWSRRECGLGHELMPRLTCPIIINSHAETSS